MNLVWACHGGRLCVFGKFSTAEWKRHELAFKLEGAIMNETLTAVQSPFPAAVKDSFIININTNVQKATQKVRKAVLMLFLSYYHPCTAHAGYILTIKGLVMWHDALHLRQIARDLLHASSHRHVVQPLASESVALEIKLILCLYNTAFVKQMNSAGLKAPLTDRDVNYCAISPSHEVSRYWIQTWLTFL